MSDELRKQVRDLLEKSWNTEWPRAAIVNQLNADPRAVSNALQYWRRRGVVECYLADEGDPVWVAVEEADDDA